MATSSDTSPSTQCPRCGYSNSRENRFCGSCGTAFDPVTISIQTYLDENLKGQIDAVIKDRFVGQEATEIALAAKASDRLIGWTKMLGFAVGIPITILAAILGAFGWNLHEALKQATSQVDAITTELRESKQRADRIAQDIPTLQRQLADSAAQLSAVPRLINQVGNLDTKITAIEQRGHGNGPEVLASSEKEGKAIGIDVSHVNSQLDWVKFKAIGVSFALIKATQGKNFADPKFLDNWQAAKKVGILRGGYHMLVGGDPAEQAKAFLQTLHREPGDLPPAIDFEQGGTGSPPPTLSDLETFAKLVEQGTGCIPIVYGGSYLLEVVGSSAPRDLGRYPLWVAQYGPAPRVADPWQTWSFWQFTDGLSINGLPPVEFNVFNGSASQLQDFVESHCKAR